MVRSTSCRKLVLFDIDQTLIDIIPYHKTIFAKTMKAIYGIDGKLTDINYSGKGNAQCVMEVGRLHGLDDKTIIAKMPAAYEYFIKNFGELIKTKGDADKKILPGVKNLLQGLLAHGHILGVQTGNVRGLAEIILKESKLEKYFPIVVTSDQGKTRSDVIGLAIEEAKKKFDCEFSGKDIVVIGDSIHDVDSGKSHNVLTIAVCTGTYTADELQQHNPDYIFKDLSDYKKVLQVIGK